jgi:hypothetical protein
MVENSLEERLKHLEKAQERLEAIHEIQNLMGKYEFLMSAMRFEKIVDLFARKAPDVSANIGDWGMYRGIDGVRKLFPGIMGSMGAGFLAEADLTTPVIEVARDGKTAKGVWMAPGIETLPWPDEKTGKAKIRAGWCYTKYANDFIKEDGKWKIWHFNNFLNFYADYDKGWVEGGEHYSRQPGAVRPFPPELQPDGPSPNRHHPYDPKTKPELLPAYPEPYETYDGNRDWMDPAKTRK